MIKIEMPTCIMYVDRCVTTLGSCGFIATIKYPEFDEPQRVFIPDCDFIDFVRNKLENFLNDPL